MPFISVTEPFDPRLGAYRDVRERDLVGRQGRFVAEGEVVLGHLLGPRSRFEAESVLVAENRLEGLAPMLAGVAAPVFVAPQAVMDKIVGFPIHRGVLGIGRIGEAVDPYALLKGGGGMTGCWSPAASAITTIWAGCSGLLRALERGR